MHWESICSHWNLCKEPWFNVWTVDACLPTDIISIPTSLCLWQFQVQPWSRRCTSSIVLMNLPYYLQFRHWRLSIGMGSDSILQQKLFMVLCSTEMVALSCVLSILCIAICPLTRWIAWNKKEIGNYDFSDYDIGVFLDIRRISLMRYKGMESLYLTMMLWWTCL